MVVQIEEALTPCLMGSRSAETRRLCKKRYRQGKNMVFEQD